MTRLGWVLHLRADHADRTTTKDTVTYVEPAKALLEEQAFTVSPTSDEPMFQRTPGYPVFLAGVFAVSDDNETAALVVQVVLSVVTAWLAFVIAARLWGETVGIVAALVNVLDPVQFQSSGQLMTESVDALLLLAFVGCGYRLARDRGRAWPWAALAGVLLAAATLVRPTTYYLMILVGLLLVGFLWRAGPRTVLATVSAFLVPVVVLIGGWQLRNQREVGSWRFSAIEAHNMYGYRAAGVVAIRDGIPFVQAQRRLFLAYERSDPPADVGDYYDEMYDRGLDIVRDHPVEAARMTFDGFISVAFGVGQASTARYLVVDESRYLSAGLAVWVLLAWSATAIGVVVAFVRDRRRLLGHLVALTTVAYVLIVSAGPEGYSRMRAPVEPILSLFAGLGLVTAWTWLHARRARVARSERSTDVRAKADLPEAST